MANIFPEIGDAGFRRAEKTALAFGKAFLDLNSMQGSVVARGLPPTLPFSLTDQDRQLFDRGMQSGPQGRSGGNGYSGPGSSDAAGNLPNAVSPAVTNRLTQIMNDLTITPRLAAAATTPADPPVTPSVSFTFSQTFSGGTFSFVALSSTTGTLSGSFSSIVVQSPTPGFLLTTLSALRPLLPADFF